MLTTKVTKFTKNENEDGINLHIKHFSSHAVFGELGELGELGDLGDLGGEKGCNMTFSILAAGIQGPAPIKKAALEIQRGLEILF